MWIANCFGQGATRLLYGKPVLCSGSIMGTKSAVRGSLESYTHLLRLNFCFRTIPQDARCQACAQ